MIAIGHPVHHFGNAVNFLSPPFLQISPDAAEPVIERVNKDSPIVGDNHDSRYPKSNEL